MGKKNLTFHFQIVFGCILVQTLPAMFPLTLSLTPDHFALCFHLPFLSAVWWQEQESATRAASSDQDQHEIRIYQVPLPTLPPMLTLALSLTPDHFAICFFLLFLSAVWTQEQETVSREARSNQGSDQWLEEEWLEASGIRTGERSGDQLRRKAGMVIGLGVASSKQGEVSGEQ